jgi:hypothetical protein
MIPGEQNRDEACSRVKQILLDPNHTPVNYKEALEHQLRRSITSHLYDLLHKPRFVDNIPPPSRQQPTAKQFVTPAAFAAALKIATGGKPSAVTGLSQVSIANPQVEQPPAASASKAMSSAMPPSVSALGSEGEPKNQLDHDDGSDSSPGTCKPSSEQSSCESSVLSDAEKSVISPTQPPPKRKKKKNPKKKPAQKPPPKVVASLRGQKRGHDFDDDSSASDLPTIPSLLTDSVPKRVRRV